MSSCAGRATLHPPADLLQHPPRPVITADALISEQAFESWRDDVDDWGQANAATIDRACWWLRDAGVAIACAPRNNPKEN